MKLLAKLRNVNDYDKMRGQQLETIFATPSAPKLILKENQNQSYLQNKKEMKQLQKPSKSKRKIKT